MFEFIKNAVGAARLRWQQFKDYREACYMVCARFQADTGGAASGDPRFSLEEDQMNAVLEHMQIVLKEAVRTKTRPDYLADPIVRWYLL